jgi:hypothetical protein
MLVGCYTLDLYCDSGRDHPVRWPNGSFVVFPMQYTGRTLAECVRVARRDGWQIGKERQLCPFCSGKDTQILRGSSHA